MYGLTIQLYQYFLHAVKWIAIRRMFYSTKHQFLLKVVTDLVPSAPCAELIQLRQYVLPIKIFSQCVGIIVRNHCLSLIHKLSQILTQKFLFKVNWLLCLWPLNSGPVFALSILKIQTGCVPPHWIPFAKWTLKWKRPSVYSFNNLLLIKWSWIQLFWLECDKIIFPFLDKVLPHTTPGVFVVEKTSKHEVVLLEFS